MFIELLITYTAVFAIQFMICMDDNPERGAITLNEHNIVPFGHLA